MTGIPKQEIWVPPDGVLTVSPLPYGRAGQGQIYMERTAERDRRGELSERIAFYL